MPAPAKRVVVAINPNASFGRNKAVGALVVAGLRSAGHEVEPLEKGDFAELLASSHAAVATKPDAFVIVGGDGMVNLGVNVLAETTVPLGIVPAGTGNDMARALGIPHDDTDAAIAALVEALRHDPHEIDAGRIHHTVDGVDKTTWFACMISAGVDAKANERANRMRRPRGAVRYVIALAIELAKLAPIRYTLTIDGVREETSGVLISIGNGVSLGGGMKVTPDAMLDDGLFDVLLVKPLSRLAFMRIFPRVYAGTHVDDPRVSVRRAEKIELDSPGLAAYADGERLGPMPIAVEVVPGALRVHAPEPRFDPPIVIAR